MPKTQAFGTTDPRWAALDLVQAAMEPLGLRDRDICVLRGLLGLVPAEQWQGAPMVFAANALLQERCGGMDERTLRRRLARLCEVGLIRRQQSPNHKRYVIRDAAGHVLLTYGFDLTPLRLALPRIEALAREAEAQRVELRALRSVLRDRLWQASLAGFPPETLAELARLLRRKVSVQDLHDAISALPTQVAAEELTASDGQIDRHIQSSEKDSFEKTEDGAKRLQPCQVTLGECIEHGAGALAFAPRPPTAWREVEDLADRLAPAIGVDSRQLGTAKHRLGGQGAALAILGLVQAQGRIRHPARYLDRLLQKAATAGLDLRRMFLSLTGSGFPAGNPRWA